MEIQERIGDDHTLITAGRMSILFNRFETGLSQSVFDGSCKFASLLSFQEFVMEGDVRKVAARTTDSHQERTLMLVSKGCVCARKTDEDNTLYLRCHLSNVRHCDLSLSQMRT